MRILGRISAVTGIMAACIFFGAEFGLFGAEKDLKVTGLLILINCMAAAVAVLAAVQLYRLKRGGKMFMPAVYLLLTASVLFFGSSFLSVLIKMLMHLPPYGLTN